MAAAIRILYCTACSCAVAAGLRGTQNASGTSHDIVDENGDIIATHYSIASLDVEDDSWSDLDYLDTTYGSQYS